VAEDERAKAGDGNGSGQAPPPEAAGEPIAPNQEPGATSPEPGTVCPACGEAAVEATWKRTPGDMFGGILIGVIAMLAASWLMKKIPYGPAPTFGLLVGACGIGSIAYRDWLGFRCRKCGRRIPKSGLDSDQATRLRKARRQILVVGLVSLALAAVLVWPIVLQPVIRHESPQGTYTAEVPRTHHDIRMTDRILPAPTGSMRIVAYSASNSKTNSAFTLSWVPLPPVPPGTVRDVEGTLRNMGESLKRDGRCTIQRQEALIRCGCTGLELWLSCAASSGAAGSGRSRWFVCGDEAVGLIWLATRTDGSAAEDGAEFLESFRYEPRL
jgi:hypothetical protein